MINHLNRSNPVISPLNMFFLTMNSLRDFLFGGFIYPSASTRLDHHHSHESLEKKV